MTEIKNYNTLHHLGTLFIHFIARCLSLLLGNGINTKLGVFGVSILLMATLLA
tara:strand:+ start:359 stop:517 length:159 start_codon:yes stop_codon:yes gene_type:complete